MKTLQSLREFELEQGKDKKIYGGVGDAGECCGTATERREASDWLAQQVGWNNDTIGDWNDENCCK